MYDIIKDITVYCPRCGKLVEGDWQTKSLECFLNTYKPGDKVPTLDSWIEVYTVCDNCIFDDGRRYLVCVDLLVRDGVLTGELY